jgi:hypothetical protein
LEGRDNPDENASQEHYCMTTVWPKMEMPVKGIIGREDAGMRPFSSKIDKKPSSKKQFFSRMLPYDLYLPVESVGSFSARRAIVSIGRLEVQYNKE